MAEEEVGLRVSLRDRRETAAGLRDVDQGLDRVGRSAETSGRRARLGAKGFAILGKAAKVGFYALAAGATAAVAASVGFVQSAAEDQKSARKLAVTLRNTTGARRRDIRSIENWITAQGKALGVADDDLRPAISTLATATGDLTKARKLTTLANNIAVGRDKSLASVATALGKAYTGSTAGLSRLGIATKDAAGQTITFDQATRALARRFNGQAAAAADTAAGKYDRFKLALSETGEAIGYQLLPYANRLGDWLTKRGTPLVEKWGDKIGTVVIPAIERFVRKARPLANQVLPAVADGLGTIRDVASKIEGPLTRTFKAFNGLPDWAKSAIAIGAGGAVVAKKVGALSLGRQALSVATGAVKSAKPIPVFVTNPGFGGPGGRPGSPGFLASNGGKIAVASITVAGALAIGAAVTVGIQKGFDKFAPDANPQLKGSPSSGGNPTNANFDKNHKSVLDLGDNPNFVTKALNAIGIGKAPGPTRRNGATGLDALSGYLPGLVPPKAAKKIDTAILGPILGPRIKESQEYAGLLTSIGRIRVEPKVVLSGYPEAIRALQSIEAFRIHDKGFKVGPSTNATLADATTPLGGKGGGARAYLPSVNLPTVPAMGDFDMGAAPDLGGAMGDGSPIHVHFNMDGREVTEVIVDRLRDKAARS